MQSITMRTDSASSDKPELYFSTQALPSSGVVRAGANLMASSSLHLTGRCSAEEQKGGGEASLGQTAVMLLDELEGCLACCWEVKGAALL